MHLLFNSLTCLESALLLCLYSQKYSSGYDLFSNTKYHDLDLQMTLTMNQKRHHTVISYMAEQWKLQILLLNVLLLQCAVKAVILL